MPRDLFVVLVIIFNDFKFFNGVCGFIDMKKVHRPEYTLEGIATT